MNIFLGNQDRSAQSDDKICTKSKSGNQGKPLAAQGLIDGRALSCLVEEPPLSSPLIPQPTISEIPLPIEEPTPAKKSRPRLRVPSDLILASITYIRLFEAKHGGHVERQIDKFPFLSSPWRSLTEIQKYKVATQACLGSGGYAFSLNLSGKREAQIAGSPNPHNALAAMIRRQLGGRLPPMCFTFEYSSAERLHVHGAVRLAEDTPEALAGFRKALRRAGGRTESECAARQLDTRPLYLGSGWARYSGKSLNQTIRNLKHARATYVSDALRRISIDWLQKYRLRLAHEK